MSKFAVGDVCVIVDARRITHLIGTDVVVLELPKPFDHFSEVNGRITIANEYLVDTIDGIYSLPEKYLRRLPSDGDETSWERVEEICGWYPPVTPQTPITIREVDSWVP